MQLTTESIIKMLPFEAEFKKQLLEGWNSFSSDQKYAITMSLWDTYSGLYQIAFEKNMQEAFLLGEDGKEKMDKDLYERIKAKTDQEMEQMSSVEVETVDLSSARQELQKILIQTSMEDDAVASTTSDPQTNPSD